MNEPSELLRRLLEASADSPIAEASSSSIDELMMRVERIFNKRPLDLSDDDIVATVQYFRHQRAKFSELAKEQADRPKRSKNKTTEIRLSSDDIEL